MVKKGRLIAMSGPSGCGKSTVMKSLMNNEIVSFTTRAPRQGEVDGRDYIFITEEEFQKLLENGGLAEHVTYFGSASYGITKEELDEKLSKGDAFAVVEVNGMLQLKKLYPDTLCIFIYMGEEDAARNMRARGDSEENVLKRLKHFSQELEIYPEYDYMVENVPGRLEETIEAVKGILDGTLAWPAEGLPPEEPLPVL